MGGKPTPGDTLMRSIERSPFQAPMEYAGPIWSFMAVTEEKEHYHDNFEFIHEEPEPLDSTVYRVYPWLFQSDRQWATTPEESNRYMQMKQGLEVEEYKKLAILDKFRQNGTSLIAHSAHVDHRMHGEYKTMKEHAGEATKLVSAEACAEFETLLSWIDMNPEYLLILSSDHGVDSYAGGKYTMHGFSEDGNAGFFTFYNPILKFSDPSPQIIDLWDVAATLSSFLRGVDVPASSVGRIRRPSKWISDPSARAYYAPLLLRNYRQLLHSAKSRGMLLGAQYSESAVVVRHACPSSLLEGNGKENGKEKEQEPSTSTPSQECVQGLHDEVEALSAFVRGTPETIQTGRLTFFLVLGATLAALFGFAAFPLLPTLRQFSSLPIYAAAAVPMLFPFSILLYVSFRWSLVVDAAIAEKSAVLVSLVGLLVIFLRRDPERASRHLRIWSDLMIFPLLYVLWFLAATQLDDLMTYCEGREEKENDRIFPDRTWLIDWLPAVCASLLIIQVTGQSVTSGKHQGDDAEENAAVSAFGAEAGAGASSSSSSLAMGPASGRADGLNRRRLGAQATVTHSMHPSSASMLAHASSPPEENEEEESSQSLAIRNLLSQMVRRPLTTEGKLLLLLVWLVYATCMRGIFASDMLPPFTLAGWLVIPITLALIVKHFLWGSHPERGLLAWIVLLQLIWGKASVGSCVSIVFYAAFMLYSHLPAARTVSYEAVGLHGILIFALYHCLLQLLLFMDVMGIRFNLSINPAWGTQAIPNWNLFPFLSGFVMGMGKFGIFFAGLSVTAAVVAQLERVRREYRHHFPTEDASIVARLFWSSSVTVNAWIGLFWLQCGFWGSAASMILIALSRGPRVRLEEGVSLTLIVLLLAALMWMREVFHASPSREGRGVSKQLV
jgi:hypothetical protein